MKELRAKIIEAVPDILDLKAGCKIITGNPFPYTHIERTYLGQYLETDDRYEGHTGKWLRLDEHTTTSIVRVIGRPITLVDVLRAIEKGERFYAVDERGYFMEMLNSDTNVNTYGRVSNKGHWNLALPLDEQSPEVIAFLSSLLLDNK